MPRPGAPPPLRPGPPGAGRASAHRAGRASGRRPGRGRRLDLAHRHPRIVARRWGPQAATAVAVLAVLPLLPRPLPDAAAAPAPAGWPASFAALHLPAGARVLVVPIPTATFTEPMRWQADTALPIELIDGYFTGPGPGGQAYIDGGAMSPAVRARRAAALRRSPAWRRGPWPARLPLCLFSGS